MSDWNERANQIFLGAIEIKDANQRQGFIAQACGTDSGLLREVEALLAADDAPPSFLEPDFELTQTNSYSSMPAIGKMIGQYKLLQVIGEGGFGVVYMAQQERPIRRKVAIKVIKPGMDTREVIARFEAERQALALMDHPNIAKVLDANAMDDGRPYFVMELVSGVPITQFCDEAKLSTRERLELFVLVCNAVQHAHQKGVVHRDIKPSNVLVTLHGETPVPIIIDFGVAKAVSQPLTEKTLFTRFGQMVGTPQYMSPEQSGISGLDVDTRSDVYSLGVLLYELLTGTTPLERERIRSAAFAEVARLIQEHEPPKPSTRLSSLSERLPIICTERKTDRKRLLQSLRGDVDWIVMKAIEKDRSRRYETANALAEDVGRCLADEPVNAGPPSTWYRYRKLIQRHRNALVTASLFTLAVTLGLVGTSVGWFRASTAKRLADERLVNENRAREEAMTNLNLARDERDRAEETSQSLKQQLYVSRLVEIHEDLNQGNLRNATRLLQLCPAELRSWEWEHLNGRTQTPYLMRRDGYFPPQFNTEGQLTILKTSHKQEAVCWDSSTGDLLWEFKNPEVGNYRVWAISHDHSMVLGHDFEFMKVWSVTSGKELWPEPQKLSRWSWTPPRFFPGDREIVWRAETVLEIRSAADGRVLRATEISPETKGFAVSPDGTLVFSGNLLMDASDLHVVARLDAQDLHNLGNGAVSPNNQLLLTGDRDGRVRLWDARSGRQLRELSAHQGMVNNVCFGPQGRRIASAGADSTIRVGDLEDQESMSLPLLGAHDGVAWGVAFSPDGRKLATSGADGLYFWNPDALSGSELFVVDNHDNGMRDVAFSPDGRHVATAGVDATLRIWDAATGQEERWFETDGRVNLVAYRPDGAQIATVVDHDGSRDVLLLDSLTGERVARWPAHQQDVYHLVFSPDGQSIGTASRDATVRVWETASGQLRYELPGRETVYGEIAFTSDERLVATCPADGVTISDATTGKPLVQIERTEEPIAFSPDDTRLACRLDNVIRLVNVKTGAIEQSFVDTVKGLTEIAFNQDGTRIWAIGDRGTLTMFDCQSGSRVASFDSHLDQLFSISLSSDGRTVVTGSTDGRIVFWETGDTSSFAVERHLVARARRIVNDRSKELTFSESVMAAVRADASLEAAVRKTALNIAAVRGDNAYQLNARSEAIVLDPNRSMEDYQLALKMARTSHAKVPRSGAYLSTLGVAQFRVEDDEAALRSLQQAHSTAKRTEARYLIELAYLAKVQLRLGDQASARAHRLELEQLITADDWSVRKDLLALLAEERDAGREAATSRIQPKANR